MQRLACKADGRVSSALSEVYGGRVSKCACALSRRISSTEKGRDSMLEQRSPLGGEARFEIEGCFNTKFALQGAFIASILDEREGGGLAETQAFDFKSCLTA